MFVHKGPQFGPGDASVLAAGDAVAAELPGIEPLGNRSGCDFTNPGHFAGSQNVVALGHFLRPAMPPCISANNLLDLPAGYESVFDGMNLAKNSDYWLKPVSVRLSGGIWDG